MKMEMLPYMSADTKDMELNFGGRKVPYVLVRKNVKNINARIKDDGIVYVSANPFVPKAQVEAFLLSKADFILHALDQNAARMHAPRKAYFTEEELKAFITAYCEKVYPYYAGRGVPFPEIRFRKMVSRWGSCHTGRHILTFSTNLLYAPEECVEYVVLHEFSHFFAANHSAAFYAELEKVCPLYKERRKKLKEIHIR